MKRGFAFFDNLLRSILGVTKSIRELLSKLVPHPKLTRIRQKIIKIYRIRKRYQRIISEFRERRETTNGSDHSIVPTDPSSERDSN